MEHIALDCSQYPPESPSLLWGFLIFQLQLTFSIIFRYGLLWFNHIVSPNLNLSQPF